MNNQSGTGTSKHCCLTAILLTVLTWTLSLFWLSAIDDGDQSEDCSLYQLYIYSVNVNWHSINSIRFFYLVEWFTSILFERVNSFLWTLIIEWILSSLSAHLLEMTVLYSTIKICHITDWCKLILIKTKLISFKAIACYTPKFLWERFEGGLMRIIVMGLNITICSPEEKFAKKEALLDYLSKHIKVSWM